MPITRRTTILAGLGLLICSCCLRTAFAVDDEIIHFNAKWWNQANNDEREGFIDGYLDCLQPPKSQSPEVTISKYQESISRTLELHPGKSVTQAIHHAQLTLKSDEKHPGWESAEIWSGPHYYSTGGYWGGGFDTHWPQNLIDRDRGYLEGYLQCFAPPVNRKTVARYQREINQHYEPEKREDDSIAVVLQHLIKASNKN